MTAPPLSRAGHPRGGRPAKVANAHRWHLIVDRTKRARGEERAARKGHGDLPDVLRRLLDAYNAGHLDQYAAPTPTPEETPR